MAQAISGDGRRRIAECVGHGVSQAAEPAGQAGEHGTAGWGSAVAGPSLDRNRREVIRIRLSQDATGGRTVSWDTAYDWGSTGGTADGAPTLTTTGGATDILGFEYVAALSKWCSLGAPFPQGF
jgi:hypothetical protein